MAVTTADNRGTIRDDNINIPTRSNLTTRNHDRKTRYENSYKEEQHNVSNNISRDTNNVEWHTTTELAARVPTDKKIIPNRTYNSEPKANETVRNIRQLYNQRWINNHETCHEDQSDPNNSETILSNVTRHNGWTYKLAKAEETAACKPEAEDILQQLQ